MDDSKVQQLVAVLKASFSENSRERDQAAVALAQFETIPGFMHAMFAAVNAQALDIGVRQSAVIYLKHRAHELWAPIQPIPNMPELFPATTKDFIKSNIIECITFSPNVIRSQLQQVLFDVLECEFPNKWPQLIPQCLSLINSQDPTRIYGALIAIKTLVKRYQYFSVSNEKRAELDPIVDQLFPTLVQLLDFLVKQNRPELIPMESLILKSFMGSCELGISPYFLVPGQLDPWLSLMCQILSREVNPQHDPSENSAKEVYPPWEVKKIVASIFDLFFQRYGTVREIDSDIKRAFGALFMEKYSVKLLEQVLNFLNSPMQSRMPKRLKTACLHYIATGTYHSKTWKVIKPHLSALAQHIFFPILMFSEEDREIFEDDPQNYMKHEFDVETDLMNPRNAVLNFLFDSVKLRGDEHIITYLNFFVNGVLNPYLKADPKDRNPALKDGALLAISYMAPLLKAHPDIKGNLEELMLVHVFPEFGSNHNFLKARAFSVFGHFANIKYNNKDAFNQAAQLVLHALNDGSLPVRVVAGITLAYLIKLKSVQPLLEPILPQVLDAYFKIMDVVDSDNLVGALQIVIKKYSTRIGQFAPVLTAKLLGQFTRILSNDDVLEDEEQSSSFITATQSIKAVIILMEAISETPELYTSLVPMLSQFLCNIRPGFVDLFNDYIELLTQYSFYSPVIADEMWVPMLKFTEIFFEWAGDFMPELLRPLDNFIYKNPEKFLASPLFPQTLRMYEKLVTGEKSAMEDIGAACSLMEVIMVNCRGKVDQFVPQLTQMALVKLKDTPPKKAELRGYLVGLVANALYYNPAMTLALLESLKATELLFKVWFKLLNDDAFESLHEKKLTILGLSAMLHVPVTQWPRVAQNEIGNIVKAVMEVIKQYTELRTVVEKELAKRQAAEEEEDDEEDEDDDDEVGDDDDLEQSDDDLLEIVNAAEAAEQGAFDDDDDVGADIFQQGSLGEMVEEIYGGMDDDYDDDLDELEVDSPLDHVDEVVFFAESLEALKQASSKGFDGLMKALSNQEKGMLNELAKEATKRKNNPKKD